MSKNPEDQQSWFRGMWEGARPSSPSNDGKETAERSNDDHDNADGEMDDDFDDFAEGNADDDFGDFDEADETEEPIAEPSLSSSLPLMSASSPSLVSSIVFQYRLSCKSTLLTHSAVACPESSRHVPNGCAGSL